MPNYKFVQSRRRARWRKVLVRNRRRRENTAGSSSSMLMLQSTATRSNIISYWRRVTGTTATAASAGLLLLLLVTIRGFSSPRSPLSSSLADLLPRDLDSALPNIDERVRFLGALGIQLLAFGGWSKQQQEDGSGDSWKRRSASPSRTSLTLQDRLAFITPVWKQGGSLALDYGRNSTGGIFRDGAELLEKYHHDDNKHGEIGITSVAQLANLLERKVGLDAATDLDASAIAALQAMLSWQIPPPNNNPVPTEKADQDGNTLLLLVFSFGNKASCRDTIDCPFGPSATDQLLAATAARFAQQQHRAGNVVRVLAQWQVATALWQKHNDSAWIVESIGTPGSYETTADILEEMLCAWGHYSNDDDIPIQSASLLAHPDHLRRVLWTAQTILQQQRGQKHSNLRTRSKPTCTLPPPDAPLLTAMQPYTLDWPAKRNLTTLHRDDNSINMFGLLEPTKVRLGRGNETITTDWYDHRLGFFAEDGNDQEWTQQRDVWILYDHWAVLKGIVTGTIDLPSISVT